VQKLTEVGAQRIALLESDHSVVRWDLARAGRQLERLQRIAREAAAQSRRCRLPVIEGPVPYGVMIAEAGAAIADPDGRPLAAALTRGPLLIGPEGGWSAAERSSASQAGAAAVSLGATVLRVETAAVVAAALMLSVGGAG
jgi:16S rRNA (uracil1498-N3)-methyltransferase